MIGVLVRVAERSESAALIAAAILVERRQRLAIAHGRAVCVLRALLLRPFDEWGAEIKARSAPVGAGKLPIDVDRASGVLAAGRIRVRRDQAIDQRLDRGALGRVEEDPLFLPIGVRRGTGDRPPGQRLRTTNCGSADQEERDAFKQFTPAKPHRSFPESLSP